MDWIQTVRCTAVSAAYLEGTIARLTTLRWWSANTNDLPSIISPTAACPLAALPSTCGKPSTALGRGVRESSSIVARYLPRGA